MRPVMRETKHVNHRPPSCMAQVHFPLPLPSYKELESKTRVSSLHLHCVLVKGMCDSGLFGGRGWYEKADKLLNDSWKMVHGPTLCSWHDVKWYQVPAQRPMAS